ncbi:MAG: prolyl-tRNA editing protein [Bacteroidetes bacterium HGW-Bacteroidetes-21]|nr:MAG: prolyl-tRNA editing protein [Bacteroidetes bacterium HGW-Bacteroidetes-21]
MRGDPRVYETLEKLNIPFGYYEHPPVPTIDEALKYWKDIEAAHCKNLFFRNHKGDRHYLVVFHYLHQMNVKVLETMLKQGKLSFASDWRLKKYLNIEPGSISPFGLIHDTEKHVKLFLDENLQHYDRLSFHPNLNTASLVVSKSDLIRYLEATGNEWEFVKLYD